ncbi:hypothetical protein ACES2L_00310 [Bdellovibrio bacteriovorus]
MKYFFLAAILFGFSTASAESIYCAFNDVNLKATYSSETNKVTIVAPSGETHELKGSLYFQKNGILKITAEGITEYLLVDTNSTFHDKITDSIYPFKVTAVAASTSLTGGCETDELKRVQKIP